MLQKLNTTISKETGTTVYTSSQLTMFSVLKDIESNDKLLNIWRSYNIRPSVLESISYYDMYTVQASDWWDLISYKIYGSSDYWWSLCIMNNVTNPFEELVPGGALKVLKKKYLFQIIKEIQTVAGK